MLGFLWILQTKMLFNFILQEEKKMLTVLSHRYTGNCDLKVQKKKSVRLHNDVSSRI